MCALSLIFCDVQTIRSSILYKLLYIFTVLKKLRNNSLVMAKIKYACIITKDDPNKRYCKPVDVIYKSKKEKEHISPSNAQDFDESHVYQVYWRSCGSNCNIEDKCCSFYKAHIISLGESEDKTLEAANKRQKRFRLKKKIDTSCESTESTVEEEVQISQSSKLATSKGNIINSSNVIQSTKRAFYYKQESSFVSMMQMMMINLPMKV
ncbi:uncharacterized protein LOC116418000 [Nasonia vitripennis]|uniref:Uncharacterized protein n=1 Tax=Nasonia vitripennis TaxID=7425 RepID=A0A7M7QPZ8_NASVI|nr:uncharacterized protein LOC116418000 [Nasonia vitripennis]